MSKLAAIEFISFTSVDLELIPLKVQVIPPCRMGLWASDPTGHFAHRARNLSCRNCTFLCPSLTALGGSPPLAHHASSGHTHTSMSSLRGFDTIVSSHMCMRNPPTRVPVQTRDMSRPGSGAASCLALVGVVLLLARMESADPRGTNHHKFVSC